MSLSVLVVDFNSTSFHDARIQTCCSRFWWRWQECFGNYNFTLTLKLLRFSETRNDAKYIDFPTMSREREGDNIFNYIKCSFWFLLVPELINFWYLFWLDCPICSGNFRREVRPDHRRFISKGISFWECCNLLSPARRLSG